MDSAGGQFTVVEAARQQDVQKMSRIAAPFGSGGAGAGGRGGREDDLGKAMQIQHAAKPAL